MKYQLLFFGLDSLLCLAVAAGCDSQPQATSAAVTSTQAFQVSQVKFESSFTKILPPGKDQPDHIEAFVTLKDQFGDPIKAVGQFRFEIYQYRPAFADPRGKRFATDGIQTFDLTDLQTNQKHWDKITRGYRIYLKLPEMKNKTAPLVLQVTFTAGENYRLQDMIVLNR